MAETVQGRRLVELPIADAAAGGEVYAEQGGAPVRFEVGEPGGLETVDYTPPSTGTPGTIKAFLDSLWAAGVGAGAALLRFLQSGASAVARTIQDKLSDHLHVKDFGAKGDGVTDDLAAITAALAEASARGGGEVHLDAADYAISAKIQIPSGCKLVGKGAGQYTPAAFITSLNFTATPRTRLLALPGFTPGSPLVECKPAAGALYAHQGVGVHGIFIDCAGIAERGLDVVSVKNSQFSDLLVFRPTSIGILESVLPVADQITEGNNATQFNTWTDITVWARHGTEAIGWQQLTSHATSNVNQNRYRNIQISHVNGDGIDAQNSDTNLWEHVTTVAFGTGYGLRLGGSDASNEECARNNTFMTVQFSGAFGNGGVLAEGLSSRLYASNHNVIYGYSTGNGTPDPVVENGARLKWFPDDEIGAVIADPVRPQITMVHARDWTTGGNDARYQHKGRLVGTSDDVNIGYLRLFQMGTSGLESTRWSFGTYQSGVEAERGFIGLGLVVGSGADRGVGTVNVDASYYIGGTKVVGARSTGWAAMTGTGSKAALAAAAAGTASAAYTQAELQAALNRVAGLEARLKAYDDALVAHGLIGP